MELLLTDSASVTSMSSVGSKDEVGFLLYKEICLQLLSLLSTLLHFFLSLLFFSSSPPSTTILILFILICTSFVYLLYSVCIAVFTLDAGLLARSQHSEGPATGHLDTGVSWFPCVYKQMLRWLPRFQVATTCFSCSPPDLNLLVTNFIFSIHVK